MRTEDQSSTLGFPVFADDASAIGTGKTGLTLTVKLRKNGGAENTVSITQTDLGGGNYWIVPISAHRDTLGVNVWTFTATNAVIAPVFERIRVAPVAAGDQMALIDNAITAAKLSTDAGQELAAMVETYIVNEGDATAVMQAVADRIATDWVAGDASPLAIVAAIKADATINTLLTRVDVTLSTRSSQTSVDDVPTNAELSIVLAAADDAALAAIAAEAIKTSAIKVKTDQLTFTVANKVDATADLSGGVSDQIDAIAAALSGGAVNPIGRVAAGGRLVVYIGDDWKTLSGTQQTIPVSDPAGGLYTKLSTLTVAKLQFGASRLNAAAGVISGTIVSLGQSTIDGVLHLVIGVELTAAGVGLQPADDYQYQIQQRQIHGAESHEFIEIEGPLSLRARRVAV